MAVVTLRQPLRRLAGGESEHRVDGASVVETLAELERLQPELRGWILDERGHVRRHINVFVNGEYGEADTAVGPDDRIDVLPAISGG